MGKKLTPEARETVNDFVGALLELREEYDGFPAKLGSLFDGEPDPESGDPAWPMLETADANYWLGYLHCAADVLGCDREVLVNKRAEALAKEVKNASEPDPMESGAGATQAGD